MEPAPTSPTIPARPAAAFTDLQRAFLDQPLFAALATIDPDGAPRQALIWYCLEPDGRILLNSRAGRRWPANLQRDGRVALAITAAGDGYAWLGLTGSVESIDDDLERARDVPLRVVGAEVAAPEEEGMTFSAAAQLSRRSFMGWSVSDWVLV